MKEPENNQHFTQRFYKDKDGQVVIFQSPNLPIVGWLSFTILEKLARSQSLDDIFSLLAFGCLFTWGWLELFSGVNYLRRIIGALVLIFAVANRV